MSAPSAIATVTSTLRNLLTQAAHEDPELLDTTVTTITAIAASGWIFDSWSGDASGTDTLAVVAMDTDKSVTANFAPKNILTDKISFLVPEGGGAQFGVRLEARPKENVTVAVSRDSGDADISVDMGSTLIFFDTMIT